MTFETTKLHVYTNIQQDATILSWFYCKITLHFNNLMFVPSIIGARGGAVVEALRYKPEGRGIDSRWCHWIFNLT
jgi:hypothetical protein